MLANVATPLRMGKSRLAVVVVTALIGALLCLSATLPASAGAYTWSSSLSPYTWSGYKYEEDALHTFRYSQYMRADYNGAGTVSVCEQVQDEDGFQLMSSKCANNHVISGDLTIAYFGWDKRVRIKNNSQWTHTIWGKIE